MSTPNKEARRALDSFQDYARGLVTTVVRMFKIAQVHHLDNRAVEPILAEVLEQVNPRLGTGERLQVQSIGESVFLNRQMIKLRGDSYVAAMGLRSIFKRLGISEVSFNHVVDTPDLRQFLGAFQKHYQGPSPKQFLQERFPKMSVRFIRPGSADDFSGRDKQQAVVRAYAQLVVATREPLEAVKKGRRPSLDSVRRSIQTLVMSAEGNEGLVLGLTRYDNLVGDPSFHAAAVATLSMLMARRLGMPRPLVMELCLAALFHDAGRVDLPRRDDGRGVSVDEYFLSARRVPLVTMLQIAKSTPSVATLERMAVAFENTLPVRGPAGSPSPGALARLVAVPCAFDLLTSPPQPRKGLLPDQAMRVIMDSAGRRFDPDVVLLFVATLGMYPVGTLVQLSGGQEGVVEGVPMDPQQADKPRVRVIKDAGKSVPYTLDLAQPGERLRIVKCLSARERDINVPHFLAG